MVLLLHISHRNRIPGFFTTLSLNTGCGSFRTAFLLAAFLLLLAPLFAVANTPRESRTVFTNSITPFPSGADATTRTLTGGELSETMEFESALRMRDYSKLVHRIGRTGKMPREDLERDHLPLATDYDQLVQWLKNEGFEVTGTDSNRLAVFARGSIGRIQQSLQTEMVEVRVEGAKYRAARTHPSLPRQIAGPVLGINGLQPYQKMRKLLMRPQVQNSIQPPFKVANILAAYNASNLGVTGSGQKIAILIDTIPSNSDLVLFWKNNNVAQSLSNIEEINVNNVSLDPPSGEETLDVEWSSGIAPGAKVRVYASGSLDFTSLDKSLQRIIHDLPSQPQLQQLSISLGLGETYLVGSSQIQTDSQYFATIAASGVSIFASSGDGGSTPDANGGNNGPVQVEYYASDPSITGVGGTSLYLTGSTGTVTSESAWNDSGGGVSQVFARPAWQSGAGVGTGSMRLVPDVALVADPNTGAYVYFQGGVQQFGGTSLSAPAWAGFCALINQARAISSQPSLGLLNTSIYPLLSSSNFRDITAGGNGHYNAGTGYDKVTGAGVPNVAVLLQTLAGQASSNPYIGSVNPLSGIANTTSVTITGLNFISVSAVRFNGTGATFAVNSSTQITTLVPSGATTGPIQVVTATGTATSPASFTVVPGPPANDNFAAAQSISGTSGTLSATNVGATKETGEPNHAGNAGGASVWYSWVAPFNGTYTFNTYGSSFDTLLAVYTGGAVGSLAQVAANDDAGTGVNSAVSFSAVAGTRYYIAVDGHGGVTGNLMLNWLFNTSNPGINNFVPNTGGAGAVVAVYGANFLGATQVQFNGENTTFTVNSTTQITTVVPNGATTGVITVITASGTTSSGAVFTVTHAPANDNYASATQLSGTAGIVAESNAGASKESGEPAHAGNAGGSSVWFVWTPPVSGYYTFTTQGSSFDTLLAVYTGNSIGALSVVASNDDAAGNVTSALSFAATAGTVYHIAVDGFGGATGNLTLGWSGNFSTPVITGMTPISGPPGTSVLITGSMFSGVNRVRFNGLAAGFVINSGSEITTTVPQGTITGPVSVVNLNGTATASSNFTISKVAANNLFANRIAISATGGTVFGTNTGATKEKGDPKIAGVQGGKSVWWTWTPTVSGLYTISTAGSSFDTLLGVFTGAAVTALTPVASNDNNPTGSGNTSSVSFNATAGTVYQIVVDGYKGATGNIVLNITPGTGTGILYSTGFETAEGYPSSGTLAGHNGWQVGNGSGGNGFKSVFPRQGRQAYIGKTSPKNGDYELDLMQLITYTPGTGDVITFNVQMEVVDSTNRNYDVFHWSAYDGDTRLFSVEFDNYTNYVNYVLDDDSGASSQDTGVNFADGAIYNLQVSIDFGSYTWSASLNGNQIISGQPVSTSGTHTGITDIDPVWLTDIPDYPAGNNYMLFDNYSIYRTGRQALAILSQPQSQTTLAGDNVTFKVLAGGSAPISYQWFKAGIAITGATNSTLTLDNVQIGVSGTYFAVAGNLLGSATSNPAILTVAAAFDIEAVPSPANGGSAAGSGVYAAGSTATVFATPASGFIFAGWLESGTAVSASASYSFTVTQSRSLVADFQATTFGSWRAAWMTPSALKNSTTAAQPSAPGNGSGGGISPLLSYAFALDPNSPNNQPAFPRARMNGNAPALAFLRNKFASDLTYIVEVSSDMIHWQAGAPYTSDPVVLDDNGNTQTVQVTVLSLPSSTGKCFMRLRVIAR